MSCNYCHVPLQKTNSEMQKCPICGLNYPRGSRIGLADNYVKRNLQLPTTEAEGELTPDQTIFINRLCDRLCRTDDLTGEPLKRALKIKQQHKQELKTVFLGKKDFSKWFDETKTRNGLHLYTFNKMIHDCLEGLRSPEAQSLQAQYGKVLERTMTK